MPPLLTSDVVAPAVNRSPHRMVPVIRVAAPKPLIKPRIYSDEPLPLKPSEHAPRKATIKQRVALPESVAYTLDIGGVDIEEVGINEILDYVSAYDLEQFENRQFEEEREILRIARLEREAERERRKQRAKTRGQVIYASDSASDSDSEEVEDVETGKHGRARPSYGHLFKVLDATRQRRRRRKRHPITNELMPLSDEEDAAFVAPSKVATSSPRVSATPAGDLPKRRRRKRDPITGELLPLPPEPTAHASIEKGKRPRRKRHPRTGELMPLGWRYDPNAEQQTYEQRRDATGGNKTPSIKRLSIAREHDTKRVKLTSEEPSSDDELDTMQSTVMSARKSKMLESVDLRDSSSREPVLVPTSTSKIASKNSMLKPTPQRNALVRPPLSSTGSSSDQKITLASFLKPSKPDEDEESSSDDSSSSAPNQKVNTPGKTSIMNPMAAQTEGESDEAEDEELEEGEWFVEAILGHHLSDPRTHPGKKQVMLYKTKWEGWENPTWEPEDSFVDQAVLEDYRKRAGLDRKKTHQVVPEPKKKSTMPVSIPKAPAAVVDESDDDEDEDEDYEVESILAHHMSDPRTHPGKPAVMLYKVKWLGWREPTWEPRQSFTDKTILRKYEKKVGMRVDASDEEDM